MVVLSLVNCELGLCNRAGHRERILFQALDERVKSKPWVKTWASFFSRLYHAPTKPEKHLLACELLAGLLLLVDSLVVKKDRILKPLAHYDT